MADILEDYSRQHGEAFTMSGVALHPMSTAATILIAEIVDRKGSNNTSPRYGSTTKEHFRCLRRCVRALSELEKTYLVARRVRKIIRMIMRLCNLGDGQQYPGSRPGETAQPTPPPPAHNMQQTNYHRENHDQYEHLSAMDTPPTTHHSHPAYDLNFLTMLDQHSTSMPSLPAWDTSWPAQDLFTIDETLPTTSQMDILCSFESFFGNGYGG